MVVIALGIFSFRKYGNWSELIEKSRELGSILESFETRGLTLYQNNDP